MDFGFICAQINQGSSIRLWKSVASRFPETGKDRLFVFPGGVYSSSSPAEAMGNYVYKLASPRNLDGAVVWLSTLSGVQDAERVMDSLYPTLPPVLVTISGKTEKYAQIPDVTFDPTFALREIIRHLIIKHSASRIAFVRGPEWHVSANSRFEAYKSVLAEFNIPYDERLVSPPLPWGCGSRAARELLEMRKLVPGKDFQAVVCASDLLMVGVEKVLKEAGYRVPEDVKICGFNDSDEAKILSIPATTAKMPTVKMGQMAVESLRKRLQGQAFVPDQSLLARPVFRKSCGCSHLFEGRTIENKRDFAKEVSEMLGLSIEEILSYFDRITQSYSDSLLGEIVSAVVEKAHDMYAVNEAVNLFASLPFVDKNLSSKFAASARERIPELLEASIAEKRLEDQIKIRNTADFLNDLMGVNRLSEIARTLKKHCRNIGFEETYLVLNKEEGISTYYEEDKSTDFPSDLILPELEYTALAPGVYVVCPLHNETEYFGHVLLKTSVYDGQTCLLVSRNVSSAVKAAFLFEETARARVLAERAEQDRTVFFSTVSENLREPLSEAAEIIKESGHIPQEEKERISELLGGAEKILDLALSRTGELELNTSLERYDVVLSQMSMYEGTGKLPCLMVDRSKIKDVLRILTDIAGTAAKITASLTRQGVLTRVFGADGEKVFKDCASVDLNLAQNIVFMHKGRFEMQDDSCSFTLPYPSLSGREAPEINEGEALAVFGKDILPSLGDLRRDSVILPNFCATGKLLPDTGAIFWNMEESSKEAYDCFRAILSSEKLKNLPFLICPDTWSRTLEDSVRLSVETGRHRILQVGDGAEALYSWVQNPEIIDASLYNAAELCREKLPDLIVVSDSDESSPDIRGIVSLIRTVRSMRKAYQTPVLVCLETVRDEDLEELISFQNVLLCNFCVLESSEFTVRVRNIIEGAEILPVLTGAIVKKAQSYLCTHACTPISRWQIAENVNVSEDYLTRIFKKELGLSPWDYLNRYRIYLARKLLRNTAMTINEVSSSTGFQDQAYFCRVFKKITGHSPSKARSSRRADRMY